MVKNNLLLRFECKDENFRDVIFEGGRYNRVTEQEMNHYKKITLGYAISDLIIKIIDYERWGVNNNSNMKELGRMTNTVPAYEITAKYTWPTKEGKKGEAVFLCNGSKVAVLRYAKEKSVDDLFEDGWKNWDKAMALTFELQDMMNPEPDCL